MRPFVDFEIFRPSEDLAASRERARERLLPRVDADVVDQFVFGLERLPFPETLFPEADVVGLLGPANVLHGDVSHQLVHGAESFRAQFLGSLIQFNPLADELLLDGLPHVAKESPRAMVGR